MFGGRRGTYCPHVRAYPEDARELARRIRTAKRGSAELVIVVWDLDAEPMPLTDKNIRNIKQFLMFNNKSRHR